MSMPELILTRPIGLLWRKTIRVLAAILAMILSAATFGDAQACKRFPPEYLVSHEELVSRTNRIALVEVMKIELAPHISAEKKIIFKPVEVLKGEFSDTIDWPKPPTRYYDVPNMPKKAFSDFDRHRDPQFWPSKAQWLPANRSEGVGGSCDLGFSFAPGSKYLGFFDDCCGRRPQHVHAFELIIHHDDAWLKKVRELVAK